MVDMGRTPTNAGRKARKGERLGAGNCQHCGNDYTFAGKTADGRHYMRCGDCGYQETYPKKNWSLFNPGGL